MRPSRAKPKHTPSSSSSAPPPVPTITVDDHTPASSADIADDLNLEAFLFSPSAPTPSSLSAETPPALQDGLLAPPSPARMVPEAAPPTTSTSTDTPVTLESTATPPAAQAGGTTAASSTVAPPPRPSNRATSSKTTAKKPTRSPAFVVPAYHPEPGYQAPDTEPEQPCHLPPVATAVSSNAFDVTHSLERARQTSRKNYLLDATIMGVNGQGESLPTQALVDGGAMEVCVSRKFYEANQHSLGPLEGTDVFARMADNRWRRFDGVLQAALTTHGITVELPFYVLPEAEWDVLLGKPWLVTVNAAHLWAVDWLFAMPAGSASNQFVFLPNALNPPAMAIDPVSALLSVQEACAAITQGAPTPADTAAQLNTISAASPIDEWADLGLLDEWAEPADVDDFLADTPRLSVAGGVRDVRSLAVAPTPTIAPSDVRARRRAEWKPSFPFGGPACTPQRAEEVLSRIKFGKNLPDDVLRRYQDLIIRKQHVFGLHARDLASNEKIAFDIELVEGARCPQRMPRDPRLTPDQRQWLHDYCTQLLGVGVLRRVDPEDVKWVSDIKLVPKKKGHWRDDDVGRMRAQANDALRRAGLPFDPNMETPEAPPAPSAWVPPSGCRLVHNYIPLNKATLRRTSYPVGPLEQKVTALAGHRLYSALDMMSGYFALRATERAQDYLTFFVEGIGYLTYTRMPFGPAEGPTRFNHFGNAVFGELEASPPEAVGGRLSRWMDDLNLASNSHDDHLRLLEAIFELAEDCGVTLAAAKTEIATDHVKWCGNIVGHDGVSSDPAKIAAVVQWPTPRTPLDVLRFVNTAAFQRNRIPDFAKIAAPLIALTTLANVPDGMGRKRGSRRAALSKVPVTWRWEKEEVDSFVLTKAAVAFSIASTSADYTQDWYVDTDASPTALGATLLQRGPDGRRHLIAAASKKCTPAESNAQQFLRELIAIRFAFDRFDSYVKGGRIIVTTDCQGLQRLLNANNLADVHVRWRESLMAYNIIKFVHRPGKRNLVCDALSRQPDNGIVEPAPEVLETWEERAGLSEGEAWFDTLPTGLVTQAPQDVAREAAETAARLLQQHQAKCIDHHRNVADVRSLTLQAPQNSLLDRFKDDALYDIIIFKLTTELPTEPQRSAATRRLGRAFFVEGEELFYVEKTSGRTLKCLPAAEGIPIARQYHDFEGHYGRDLVLLRVRKDGFYWAHQRATIEEVVRSCPTCQSWGSRHTAALLGPIIYPQPFDLMAADYVMVRREDGVEAYALVFVEYFSHFVWAFPGPGTGEHTAACLRKLAAIATTPIRLLTDNGSHFVNETVKAACVSLDIAHTTTAIFAPWTNGVVERSNGLLLTQLRKICGDNTVSWHDAVDIAVRNINSRVLHCGYSPYELLFGVVQWGPQAAPFESRIDPDPDQPVPEHLVDVRATLVDLLRGSITDQQITDAIETSATGPVHDLEVGDLVMIREQKPKDKLAPLWKGPFRVVEAQLATAQLETLDGLPIARRHHVNNLKLFQAAST